LVESALVRFRAAYRAFLRDGLNADPNPQDANPK
jgi:hypothetical protein